MLDVQALKTTIGNKLKEAREESGYSQKNLADLIGLTKVGYGAIERGQNLVSLQYLIPLARILDKPLAFFLPGYISPEENDILHHRYIPRLLAAFDGLDDDAHRLNFIMIMELAAQRQAEKREGSTKT